MLRSPDSVSAPGGAGVPAYKDGGGEQRRQPAAVLKPRVEMAESHREADGGHIKEALSADAVQGKDQVGGRQKEQAGAEDPEGPGAAVAQQRDRRRAKSGRDGGKANPRNQGIWRGIRDQRPRVIGAKSCARQAGPQVVGKPEAGKRQGGDEAARTEVGRAAVDRSGKKGQPQQEVPAGGAPQQCLDPSPMGGPGGFPAEDPIVEGQEDRQEDARLLGQKRADVEGDSGPKTRRAVVLVETEPGGEDESRREELGASRQHRDGFGVNGHDRVNERRRAGGRGRHLQFEQPPKG